MPPTRKDRYCLHMAERTPMQRIRTIPLAGLLSGVLWSGSASGWTPLCTNDPEPTATPAHAAPSPSKEIDLAPVGGSISAPRPAAVIAEGAIVTMMPGTLIWDAKGGLIFRPDANASDGAPAFTQSASLLPCTALARFESMLGVGVSDAPASSPPSTARSSKDGHPPAEVPMSKELGRYYINGQVFAFHGRPYILLSVPPTTTPPKSDTPAPTDGAAPATPSTTSAAKPSTPLSESTDVQSLITELEQRRTTARALETAATLAQSKGDGSAAVSVPSPTTQDKGAPGSARPDGQHINGRQGRVVRHDAWLIFTPDSGTSAPSDPPMVLLPSAQMERLEGLVFRFGDSARYRISGKLITYKGRQFLLPTLAQVLPPSDLSPTQ